MTEVFYTCPGDLTDREFEVIFTALCKGRQDKILALKRSRDRLLCLGAGFLLKTALERHGLSDSLVISGTGKPFLKGNELYFSLSHSGERAMCALSDREIGCDCQKILPYKQRIAQKYFSQNEIELIKNSHNADAEFTRIWSLKESLVKLTGEGICGMSKADVFCCGGRFFREYDLNDGHKYSVCAKNDGFPKAMEYIDIKKAAQSAVNQEFF